MKSYSENNCDNFRNSMCPREKRCIFEAVNDEHGKYCRGKSISKVSDHRRRRFFRRKKYKRKGSCGNACQSAKYYCNNLFIKCHDGFTVFSKYLRPKTSIARIMPIVGTMKESAPNTLRHTTAESIPMHAV